MHVVVFNLIHAHTHTYTTHIQHTHLGCTGARESAKVRRGGGGGRTKEGREVENEGGRWGAGEKDGGMKGGRE